MPVPALITVYGACTSYLGLVHGILAWQVGGTSGSALLSVGAGLALGIVHTKLCCGCSELRAAGMSRHWSHASYKDKHRRHIKIAHLLVQLSHVLALSCTHVLCTQVPCLRSQFDSFSKTCFAQVWKYQEPTRWMILVISLSLPY